MGGLDGGSEAVTWFCAAGLCPCFACGRLLCETPPEAHEVASEKTIDILRLRVKHATPKGDAVGMEVLKDEKLPVHGRLIITGDPLHEVFALQRLATPAANDCIDFLNDHKDMLTRFSAPPGTCVANSEPEAQLTETSRQLLHDVVCKSSGRNLGGVV